MSARFTRRSFLGKSLAGGALLGLGDVGFLDRLRPVGAAEARLDPSIVRFDPSIEPLVRLLEDTPRDRLIEEVVARIKRGVGYRDILAALLLAGVRNVQPRPSVGFKFHAVLVVNSAHLASLSSPVGMRWLPILWAIDYFKSSQARDVEEGNWTMRAADESAMPSPSRAREAFTSAMDRWDESGVDAAVTALARHSGASEIFELFFRYGARDFRSIGHKAIYVANSWRTLNCIGWRHAEPVLRSLAYALLNHHGEDNPSKSDLSPDRPWRRNLELVRSIKPEWRAGAPDDGATASLLSTLRTGSDEDASRQVVELLGRGCSPASIWDAMLLGAAELVMRKPGILTLHAATTTNALRFAFETTADDETRRLLLLQNAAFLPLFREAAIRRGGELDATTIEKLQPAEPEGSGRAALREIFADLGRDRLAATRKTLAFLRGAGQPDELINAARLLVFLKGDDAHDYKYSSAVLEDCWSVSGPRRDEFVAASMSLLRNSGERDNSLVERVSAAFERVPARTRKL